MILKDISIQKKIQSVIWLAVQSLCAGITLFPGRMANERMMDSFGRMKSRQTTIKIFKDKAAGTVAAAFDDTWLSRCPRPQFTGFDGTKLLQCFQRNPDQPAWLRS